MNGPMGVHHEVRRFPDGSADWKREYDDLGDRLTGLNRDYGAARRVLERLMAGALREWLVLRAGGEWKASDALRATLADHGVKIGASANGATWAIDGTLVGGKVES